MLDRRDHQVAADTPTPGERSGDRGVHRPGPRRGEGELVGAAPHGLRGGLPGGVQQQPRPPPLPVQPGRVGPALVQGGKQRLAGDRVQGAEDAASK